MLCTMGMEAHVQTISLDNRLCNCNRNLTAKIICQTICYVCNVLWMTVTQVAVFELARKTSRHVLYHCNKKSTSRILYGPRVEARGLEPPQGASGKTGPLRGL